MPELPEGYIIASMGSYPKGLVNSKTGKTYTVSVQLLNPETGDMPRGVGNTGLEAMEDALSNVGGDDGFSPIFRKIIQGNNDEAE